MQGRVVTLEAVLDEAESLELEAAACKAGMPLSTYVLFLIHGKMKGDSPWLMTPLTDNN